MKMILKPKNNFHGYQPWSYPFNSRGKTFGFGFDYTITLSWSTGIGMNFRGRCWSFGYFSSLVDLWGREEWRRAE
jgi:hypothetical protein